jgi:hypothetical protein
MGKTHCAESSLDELFHDIAVQLLMRRDGVTERDIRAPAGPSETGVGRNLGGDRVQPSREIAKQS